MPAQVDFITQDLLVALSKYLRLTNYIGAAELYLKDNFLLNQPLQKEHIKKRVLGHWGTVPGINFIYASLNIILQRHQQPTMLIVGPGHGYPALLANLFVEGSLGHFYPEYKFSKSAFGDLIKHFSWPGGFPSHANPETPGVILEGGELGYALSTAYGVAFDNPDLIVACIVGDGEAETAATATAWHSNKFLNAKTSGAVLPIVHINKYKISAPTIYGTMSDDELTALFKGYGYNPIIVEGDMLYEPMLKALDDAYRQIKTIQNAARQDNQLLSPRWPMILLRSKKGWTGPEYSKGKMIEDSFRSHGIPLENVLSDDEEFATLEKWLRSYKVEELFDQEFRLDSQIQQLIPAANLRMGMSPMANGGAIKKKLHFPDPSNLALDVDVNQRGHLMACNIASLGNYLSELIKLNPDNVRVMSPDETESNKLHPLFKVTKRAYVWPLPEAAEDMGPDGRVMEMLSEHTLQGWMQGYILSGRYAIFVSYEAFMMIIASMVDQYAKYLLQMQKIAWRKPLPSMNFVLTSTSWRQDHNGFSHQNPGFISDALNKHSELVNIHFPPDANMLLSTIEDCFASENKINIIVTCKRDLPQYLTLTEAKEQIKSGLNRWAWAGNNDKDPDVIFAATGEYSTQEALAAIKLLKELIPEMSTRFVNISELTCFGIGDTRNACRVSMTKFNEIFTRDRDIIYTYHGYPEDIKQLIYNHPAAPRFKIHGYIEKGTTTTPFDMQVLNRASRYHLALEAVESASKVNPKVMSRLYELKMHFDGLLLKHNLYIREHGVDMPEIADFKLN